MEVRLFVNRFFSFKFLDLQPAIQRSGAETLTVSSWDNHPNEIVHRIAAEEIYDRLIDEELIPTSVNLK